MRPSPAARKRRPAGGGGGAAAPAPSAHSSLGTAAASWRQRRGAARPARRRPRTARASGPSRPGALPLPAGRPPVPARGRPAAAPASRRHEARQVSGWRRIDGRRRGREARALNGRRPRAQRPPPAALTAASRAPSLAPGRWGGRRRPPADPPGGRRWRRRWAVRLAGPGRGVRRRRGPGAHAGSSVKPPVPGGEKTKHPDWVRITFLRY